MWEESHHEEAAALATLAEIIKLSRQPDATAEILALQWQVVGVLPSIAAAVTMAPALTLAQSESAGRAPAGDETDDSDELAAKTIAECEVIAPADQRAQAPDHPTEEAGPCPAVEPEAAGPARTTAARTTAPQPGRGSTDIPAAPLTSSSPASRTSLEAPVPAPAPATTRPAQHAPVHEVAPPSGDDTDDSAVERALAQLIEERRFGLAHHVAKAADRPEPHVAALRLAGAAALLSFGDSQGARLTADLLQEYGGYAGRDIEGSELLLLPALLRTALITGDHSAGAQLKALVPRLPGRLGEAATAVADRALSGALMIASPLAADSSEGELRLRERA